MATPVDHSDLFLAVLTFVPVLWITTGFASEAARRLVVRVRDARLTVKISPLATLGIPVTFIIKPDQVVASMKFLWFPPQERVLVKATGRNLVSAGIAGTGIAVYVISGIVAESLSLFALYSKVEFQLMANIVFAAASITLLMTGAVVATTLGAVFVDAFGGEIAPLGSDKGDDDGP